MYTTTHTYRTPLKLLSIALPLHPLLTLGPGNSHRQATRCWCWCWCLVVLNPNPLFPYLYPNSNAGLDNLHPLSVPPLPHRRFRSISTPPFRPRDHGSISHCAKTQPPKTNKPKPQFTSPRDYQPPNFVATNPGGPPSLLPRPHPCMQPPSCIPPPDTSPASHTTQCPGTPCHQTPSSLPILDLEFET